MDPEKAQNIANKLKAVINSNGPDGEKAAARNRLDAITKKYKLNDKVNDYAEKVKRFRAATPKSSWNSPFPDLTPEEWFKETQQREKISKIMKLIKRARFIKRKPRDESWSDDDIINIIARHAPTNTPEEIINIIYGSDYHG